MIEKKKLAITLFILATCWAVNLLGIRWGIPSQNLHCLYFDSEKEIKTTVSAIEKYPVEDSWKGWGGYLAIHPDEADRKLPRNLYNPLRSYHPDEYAVIKSLSYMQPRTFDFNPHQFAMGGAYIYLVGLVLFILAKLHVLTTTQNLSFYFFHPDALGQFFIAGRAITAFFGAGICTIAFLIAKKLLCGRSLQAIAIVPLILFAPLMALNSRYMYVDISGTFWITLCTLFSLDLLEHPSPKKTFVCGVCAGLATGTKIPFAISCIIPLLALLLTVKKKETTMQTWFYLAAGGILAFLVTNPYILISFASAKAELVQHAETAFSGAFYVQSLKLGLGEVLAITAAIGIILRLYNTSKSTTLEKRTTLLFVTWISVYFLFIAFFSKTFARYLLPIVPHIIILGMAELFRFMNGPSNSQRILARIFAVLVFFYTFAYGGAFIRLALQENVRTTAGQWFAEHVPPKSRVGITEIPWQFQLFPINPYKYQLIVTEYSVVKVKKTEPNWFVLSAFQAPLNPHPRNLEPWKYSFFHDFSALETYKKVKEFSKPLSFLGLKFTPKVIPEDLLYLNPSITIFKRKIHTQ